jgi:hypothetical protein
MVKFKFDSNTEVVKDLKKFREDISNNIVFKGLDERLASDVMLLKKQLLNVINQAKPEKPTDQTTVTEPEVFVTKSESELIKHFTGLDPNDIRKSQDFTKLIEGKVAFVRKDRNMLGDDTAPSRMTPGVSYRLDMSQYDTFESQHSRAIDYFNNSLYVIEEGGKRRIFANPGGHDLSRFVKVVCTREQGDTAAARKRFEKYRNGNNRSRNADTAGFADWTLQKEGIEYIRKNFVDLTDIVEKIKEGDEEEAFNIAARKGSRSEPIRDFQEKLQDIKDRKNLNPSTEAYLNLVRLVKNLKILKRVSPNIKVEYSLVTNDNSSTQENDDKFVDSIKNHIYMWEVSHQEKWVSTLLRKIDKILQKYTTKET